MQGERALGGRARRVGEGNGRVRRAQSTLTLDSVTAAIYCYGLVSECGPMGLFRHLGMVRPRTRPVAVAAMALHMHIHCAFRCVVS